MYACVSDAEENRNKNHQYLWFLESLFTPSPYPKPLQLRVWVSLPFPAASLSYINQPLQIWAVLAPGWIALVFFALLAFSLLLPSPFHLSLPGSVWTLPDAPVCFLPHVYNKTLLNHT